MIIKISGYLVLSFSIVIGGYFAIGFSTNSNEQTTIYAETNPSDNTSVGVSKCVEILSAKCDYNEIKSYSKFKDDDFEISWDDANKITVKDGVSFKSPINRFVQLKTSAKYVLTVEKEVLVSQPYMPNTSNRAIAMQPSKPFLSPLQKAILENSQWQNNMHFKSLAVQAVSQQKPQRVTAYAKPNSRIYKIPLTDIQLDIRFNK